VNRLRVLHFIYDDPTNPWVGGGGARRVFDLYRHLVDRVDATIVTGRFPGASDTTVDGIRVRRVGAATPYAWSRASYAVAASLLLRRAAYDVALVDHSGYAPVVIPRDRPVGVVVHHLAGPGATERWPRGGGRGIAALERRLLRRARWLSATSRATAGQLAGLLPSTARVVQITSGVPDALFDLPRDDRGYVLYVGRIDARQKGLDVLIDAFASVVREVPAARLRLAGRGPDLDALRARADRLGVGGAVEFVGHVSDAERGRLMAGAALQVLPSRFEGFGIAAAEALAAGVPLVVSSTPALAEMVAPADSGDDAGRVVPIGDAAALADAILYLLRRADARHRLSRNGRRIAERFRWRQVAASHLDFLEQVAAAFTNFHAGSS
jgi:glycosyltransferase involved in cell wall biosynthesis